MPTVVPFEAPEGGEWQDVDVVHANCMMFTMAPKSRQRAMD